MKKFTKIMASLIAFLSIGLTSCQKAPFQVGKDTTEVKAEGASEWASTATANVQIVAGKDTLYSGTVTVTSDNLWAYEFIEAACAEKDLQITGANYGFITNIGSYVNDTTTNTYWGWEYNGHENTPFGVNQIHIFDGDYIYVSYSVMTW